MVEEPEMTPEILGRIATAPFDRTIEFSDVPAKYLGTAEPIVGKVSIEVRGNRIHAELTNEDGWAIRARKAVPNGSFTNTLNVIRPSSPGQLVRPEHRASIVPDDGSWEAHLATHYGTSNFCVFQFWVDSLTVNGPASDAPVAAVRQIYARGSWTAVSEFQRRPLLITSLTKDEADECEDNRTETMAVTVDWNIGEHHKEAIWNTLCFVTGNTVVHLAEEHYSEDGRLVRREYHFGSPSRDMRQEFFHIFHGQLSAEGVGVIADGMYRLLREEFPIEVIVQHLLAAARNTVDVEAQHLVLAIHTAIEAWNRFFGRDVWIKPSPWKTFSRKIRKEYIPQQFYDLVGANMEKNIREVLGNANRTTTGWRQEQFFRAMQIDVSDLDSVRILGLRNEVLHNGHFVKRFDQLTHEERQERFSDIDRLRRVVLLIIFRLLAFTGNFMNPVTFHAERVEAVPLPDRIAPPAQR